ncbi:MAG: cytidylate kinase family protein [candidate division NC10 bacterium]|mgnify:CR=1 FL=1
MTIVAISRELGSGGTAMAAAIAKALNFEYVDREIVLQAAQVHGVPEEKIADVDERRLSLWERFDEEKRRYLIFIEAAYYSFAEKGNVVTAGRGGPFFLRDVSHALKVRIMAPFEVRVKRVMEQEKVDQRTATARVRNYDRELSARIDYLFGLDWTLPEHYDLVINTGADAWQFYTDLLVWAARHPQYQPTPESQQRIRDLSLAAQVRAAIAKDPMTKNINVEVAAQSGRVALKGVVFSPAMMDAAADVAKRVPGVTSVSCEAVEIPRVYPGPIM